MEDGLSSEFAEGVVSICRTSIGDSLRSVIHFTPSDFEMLYLRSDLYSNDRERAQEVQRPFVDNERLGFDSKETYRELETDPDTEPDIGTYEFTIRVFSEGFISRVIVGDHGIILTTDGLDLTSFETVAIALRVLLKEI